MKKIMLVFGTRPEAIKMAPLVKAFQAKNDEFETIVCVTGQHREMLDQVLHLFDIKPDFDLNIMKQGQDLYDITSRVLLGMRDVFKVCKPDILFVHGDTTTSTAAALAGFYQQIPVAHVEAGLRTKDIYSPWPEEMNRQITGRIATYNLSPTQLSRQNLLKENVDENKITVTGNTVIDALHWVTAKIKSDKKLDDNLSLDLKSKGYDTTDVLYLSLGIDERTLVMDFYIYVMQYKIWQRNSPKSISFILCTSILMFESPFTKSLEKT